MGVVDLLPAAVRRFNKKCHIQIRRQKENKDGGRPGGGRFPRNRRGHRRHVRHGDRWGRPAGSSHKRALASLARLCSAGSGKEPSRRPAARRRRAPARKIVVGAPPQHSPPRKGNMNFSLRRSSNGKCRRQRVAAEQGSRPGPYTSPLAACRPAAGEPARTTGSASAAARPARPHTMAPDPPF